MVDIKYGRGSNGRLFCDNPVEFLTVAESKGLSRKDIADIAGVDTSTIRLWLRTVSDKHKQGYSSVKPIRKLKTYLDNLGYVKSTEQLTQRNDRVVEIARWLADGEQIPEIAHWLADGKRKGAKIVIELP
jgi:DNA-binding NarL/FixJ family response regulator